MSNNNNKVTCIAEGPERCGCDTATGCGSIISQLSTPKYPKPGSYYARLDKQREIAVVSDL